VSGRQLSTAVCIVGGGPCGMMLGVLLARAGVDVTVLEKYPDFFRDFRGDTVHPSTLELLYELGWLDDFLALPHDRFATASANIAGQSVQVADLTHLPTHCKFVALMPQWDFLNFLAERAKRFPSFDLLMEHEVTGTLHDHGRTTGVTARYGNMTVDIRAHLVVACDGRHSAVRKSAGLQVIDHGVPIDVLWFSISRRPDDPAQVLGNVNYGKLLILIDRGDYFQAGLMIQKGSFDSLKARGLEALRDDIRRIAPSLSDRVDELRDWDQIKILTVQINRLLKWFQPGLLCIGDAAHAMSPAGGVGINLAIQDAVATANLLAEPLANRWSIDSRLAAVQRRREFPARLTQAIQLLAHRRMAKLFDNPGPIQAPWQMKVFVHIPGIHRALGYAIGMGARPEHVQEKKTAHRPLGLLRTVLYASVGVAVTLAASCCNAVESGRSRRAWQKTATEPRTDREERWRRKPEQVGI
jgi:2-polyprenyl-6-methoxyphenol hydroxylase-like FAD-dependent oxidoreductase